MTCFLRGEGGFSALSFCPPTSARGAIGSGCARARTKMAIQVARLGRRGRKRGGSGGSRRVLFEGRAKPRTACCGGSLSLASRARAAHPHTGREKRGDQGRDKGRGGFCAGEAQARRAGAVTRRGRPGGGGGGVVGAQKRRAVFESRVPASALDCFCCWEGLVSVLKKRGGEQGSFGGGRRAGAILEGVLRLFVFARSGNPLQNQAPSRPLSRARPIPQTSVGAPGRLGPIASVGWRGAERAALGRELGACDDTGSAARRCASRGDGGWRPPLPLRRAPSSRPDATRPSGPLPPTPQTSSSPPPPSAPAPLPPPPNRPFSSPVVSGPSKRGWGGSLRPLDKRTPPAPFCGGRAFRKGLGPHTSGGKGVGPSRGAPCTGRHTQKQSGSSIRARPHQVDTARGLHAPFFRGRGEAEGQGRCGGAAAGDQNHLTRSRSPLSLSFPLQRSNHDPETKQPTHTTPTSTNPPSAPP